MSISFQILGRVAVTADGREVDVRRARHRAILGLLLLAEGSEVHRDAIVESLWGADPPRAPSNAVHVYVRELRNLLDGVRAGLGRAVLLTTSTGYRVEAHPAAIDALTFREWAEAGRRALELGETPEAERHLEAALRLWVGSPLAGTPVTGALAGQVAALEELHLSTAERRIDVLEALGRDEDAIVLARRLAAEQPHRESAQARLMVGLYRSGRQGEALDAYMALYRRLVDERGTPPSPLLRSLQQRILRHDPTLEAGRSALPGGAVREELVGRERDVEGVAAALRGEASIVTLAGPPGVGTTAVARAVAARLAARGTTVHWIDGGAAPGPGDLAAAVATVAPGGAGQGPVAVVVLDRPAADSGPAVKDARERGVRVLVTAPSGLGLGGERVWPLAPLAVPRHGAVSAAEVGESDAARLLVRRARIVDPAFRLDDGTAPAVARLCRELDGLPLAIELAARQMGELSVDDVVRRLEESPLDALSAGPDLPERQRSLRALVESAVARLGPAGMSALPALAVLPGGFDAELLGRVAGIDREAATAAARELAAAGLARREPGGGATRWRPGVAAAHRAREERRAGDVRARRDAWAAEFAERLGRDYWGGGQRTAHAAIRREHETLVAALEAAVHNGQPAIACRIVGGLFFWWWMEGAFSGGRALAEQALSASGPVPDAVLRRALARAAALAWAEADMEGAAARAAEALALEEPDPLEAAISGAIGGGIAATRGDIAAARSLLGRALDDALESGEPGLAAMVYRNLAGAEIVGGAPREGLEICERGLVLARAAENAHQIASLLVTRADALAVLGRSAEARADLDRALSLIGPEGSAMTRAVATAALARLDAFADPPVITPGLVQAILGVVEHGGLPWAMPALATTVEGLVSAGRSAAAARIAGAVAARDPGSVAAADLQRLTEVAEPPPDEAEWRVGATIGLAAALAMAAEGAGGSAKRAQLREVHGQPPGGQS